MRKHPRSEFEERVYNALEALAELRPCLEMSLDFHRKMLEHENNKIKASVLELINNNTSYFVVTFISFCDSLTEKNGLLNIIKSNIPHLNLNETDITERLYELDDFDSSPFKKTIQDLIRTNSLTEDMIASISKTIKDITKHINILRNKFIAHRYQHKTTRDLEYLTSNLNADLLTLESIEVCFKDILNLTTFLRFYLVRDSLFRTDFLLNDSKYIDTNLTKILIEYGTGSASMPKKQ